MKNYIILDIMNLSWVCLKLWIMLLILKTMSFKTALEILYYIKVQYMRINRKK